MNKNDMREFSDNTCKTLRAASFFLFLIRKLVLCPWPIRVWKNDELSTIYAAGPKASECTCVSVNQAILLLFVSAGLTAFSGCKKRKKDDKANWHWQWSWTDSRETTSAWLCKMIELLLRKPSLYQPMNGPTPAEPVSAVASLSK